MSVRFVAFISFVSACSSPVSGLVTARLGHASLVAGTSLYVVGGADDNNTFDTIERATINPDGSLGAFAIADAKLATPRTWSASVVAANNVYLIGGLSGVAFVNNAEQASINADGSLGTFATSSSLQPSRLQSTSVVTGNHLYVIGGTPGGAIDYVAEATVGSNGLLGTIANDGSVRLVTGRSSHTSTVVGSYIYVIGGETSSGSALDSVERAPINADGSIGTFATVSGVTLATARSGQTSVVIENHLYVLGGFGTTGDPGNRNLNTIEEAAINPDGSLGTFAITGTLATGRGWHSSVVVGNYLYVIGGGGGTSGGVLDSVERAPINADGSLGTFAIIPG